AVVLDGLRQFARRGLICEPVGTVARSIDVSVDTVRRGIDDLLAAGLLEATGLGTAKARQYRLTDIDLPLLEDAAPQMTVAEESPPKGGSSATRSLRRSTFVGSPMERGDRDWVRLGELAPMEQ